MCHRSHLAGLWHFTRMAASSSRGQNTASPRTPHMDMGRGGGMDRTLFQVAGTESEAIPPITST